MDDIMIALLPVNADWCTLELPHLTLIYSGEIKDHSPGDYNRMSKDVASLAMISTPICLDVMNVDVLGPPDDRVSVLSLRPSIELLSMRNLVKQWDRSEWPEYKPHATIGPRAPEGGSYPSRILFDRLYVGWGSEDSLTFYMRNR